MTMQMTNEQIEILKFIKGSESNLKISAFAGAGKTSTLRMIAKELYPRTFLYLAYNKDIRAEAQESFGDNVYCMTYHAIARRAMQIDKTKFKDKLKNGLKKSELIKILKLNEQNYTNQYNLLNVIQKTASNFKNSRDDSIHEGHLDTDGIIELTSIPLEQQKLAYFILKKVKKMWDMETDES